MRNLKTDAMCVAFACMGAAPAFGRQLTAEEAFGKVPAEFKAVNTRSVAEPLYTERVGGRNVAYVFSGRDSGGYVVSGADDLLPAVLGYSDKGGFDAESMPPAMRYWLEEYGRQLEYAVANGLEALKTRRVPVRPSIAPLCETAWSQSSPFNDNCPMINGRHAPAGCTATALSQVMYFHKWPERGTGHNTYLSGVTREKMEFDFESTLFDWSSMLPAYSSGHTDAQKAAVATLLEACGNAMLMSYGASASGAYPYDAAWGMVRFLGYDRGVEMVRRDYYTSATWDEMIYSELSEGRPVMYGGYDSNFENGHTFVVDGYGGDGYYHVNWGWGGKSNGYFLLTALDPAEQGIGGSGSGYNFRQDGIIRIMPAKDDSDYALTVMWNGPFAPVNQAYTSVGTVEFTAGDEGSFEGFTLTDTKAKLGVRLIPDGGGEGVFYPAGYFDFPSHYGEYWPVTYERFFIPVSDLPKEGVFTVRPAYEHNGEVKDVEVRVGVTDHVVMTCSSRGVKFEIPRTERTLTADNVKAVSKLYSGKPCSVSADIRNSGDEYLGMVKAGFVNGEGEVRTWLDGVPVSLTDGASVNVLFTGVLDSYNTTLPAGRYTLNVYDESGAAICAQPPTVEVLEAPEGKPVIEVSLNVANGQGGDGSGIDPYLIGDEMDLEVKVDVSSGLFEDAVALYAYYSDNTALEFSADSNTYKSFFVAPGESETAVFRLGTSGFELDRTAYIRAYGWKSDWSAAGSGWMGRNVYVKRVASGVSGIKEGQPGLYPNTAADFTTVESGSAIIGIEVYSVAGQLMASVKGNGTGSQVLDASGLQAGHYVVLVKTVSGAERHRLLKK